MLHRPHRKITIIYKYKCLQRSRDIVNLYSVHFYHCRFASLGQELEISVALHNREKVIRRSDGKVNRRARKLAVSPGATWIGTATVVSKWEINCVILSYCEVSKLTL